MHLCFMTTFVVWQKGKKTKVINFVASSLGFFIRTCLFLWFFVLFFIIIIMVKKLSQFLKVHISETPGMI